MYGLACDQAMCVCVSEYLCVRVCVCVYPTPSKPVCNYNMSCRYIYLFLVYMSSDEEPQSFGRPTCCAKFACLCVCAACQDVQVMLAILLMRYFVRSFILSISLWTHVLIAYIIHIIFVVDRFNESEEKHVFECALARRVFVTYGWACTSKMSCSCPPWFIRFGVHGWI